MHNVKIVTHEDDEQTIVYFNGKQLIDTRNDNEVIDTLLEAMRLAGIAVEEEERIWDEETEEWVAEEDE